MGQVQACGSLSKTNGCYWPRASDQLSGLLPLAKLQRQRLRQREPRKNRSGPDFRGSTGSHVPIRRLCHHIPQRYLKMMLFVIRCVNVLGQEPRCFASFPACRIQVLPQSPVEDWEKDDGNPRTENPRYMHTHRHESIYSRNMPGIFQMFLVWGCHISTFKDQGLLRPRVEINTP